MFEQLIGSWRRLQDAVAAMNAAEAPPWPWNRTSVAYLENQRLRDVVQGRGMNFAAQWRDQADDVRSMVDGNPDVFAVLHVRDRKGERPDPTLYMQSMTVMPILIRIAECG